MEIKLCRPTDPLLQTYIECFYTLKRSACEAPVRYAAFPSNYAMVCLNAEARVETSGNDMAIRHDPEISLASSIICEFDSAGWITYEGPADEIVIYFKPLAINAFLDQPLRTHIRSFTAPFDPHPDYLPSMLEIFALKRDDERIALLEAYLLSKFNGHEHPFLRGVIDELVSDEFDGSITQLAARHGVSRTTLVKHFDRYICTTPSQFKKITRFRDAMRHHRTNIHDRSLSAISCEADYFDQSHMIKDFKSLTTLPPKTFFSKISTLEDGQINWLFA